MGADRVLIVANPAAAGVGSGLVWELVRLCQRQVARVSVRWTAAPGDATRIATKVAESEGGISLAERGLTPFGVGLGTTAAASPRTVVVAVGGDGTVREVAAGLAAAWRGAAPPLLSIVPAGAGNAGYHSLFGDAPWQEVVAATLTTSSVRWLDLARVAGRLVFAGAVVRFAGTDASGRVTVDGLVVHSGLTTLVDVAGGRCRGDGLLDVRVTGGAETRTRGRRVRIERTDGQPLWCSHDGEVLPAGTEYTVETLPAAVSVLPTPPLALTA